MPVRAHLADYNAADDRSEGSTRGMHTSDAHDEG